MCHMSDAIVTIRWHQWGQRRLVEGRHNLNEEAVRIAALVNSRVTASGTIFEGKRPDRSAPINFVGQVAELLKATPLTCALCGGRMYLKPANKLLQPSPDRIDSEVGDYGPDNFQLVHLACNLDKSNAPESQFDEWLQLVKSATELAVDCDGGDQ